MNGDVALVVDVDGTLVGGDLLAEGMARLLGGVSAAVVHAAGLGRRGTRRAEEKSRRKERPCPWTGSC